MPVGVRAWFALGSAATVAVALMVALVVLAHSSPAPDTRAVVQTVPVWAPPEALGSAPPVSAPTGEVTTRPSTSWTQRVASSTGIPARAVEAYGTAQLTIDASDPTCHLGWNTLAGIGAIESDHGRHDGSAISSDGVDRPTVLGPQLDGTDGNKALPDTDGGRLDGDTVWDRAVGPMQFIPQTWAEWGRSVAGAVPDPNNIDDAALTAGVYLCAAGTDMATTAGWNAAIASYNEPVEYAVDVADSANRYAAASRS